MIRNFPLLLIILFTSLTANLFGQSVNYEVSFHTGKVQFSENFESASVDIPINSNEVFEGYYFRMLQFYDLPNQSERVAMENKGFRFLGYIPHNTYIVGIPVGFDWSTLETTKFRSMQSIDSNWKTGKKLMGEAFGNTSDEQVEVLLTYPDIFSIDQVEQACAAHGITVMRSSRYENRIKASLPLNTVVEKAALPFISFIEKVPPPAIPEDDNGRSLHRSNVIDTDYPSGYQFNGEGVNVLVRDDGVIGPHIDFAGRLDNSFQPTGTVGDHGTNVASTLGGSGNIDPYGRGMADGAFIYGIFYESTFMDTTMDLYFNEDVLITNSSYSDGCNDGYTTNAQLIDQQTFDNTNLIHVFSAGNSGNSDCDYGAGAGWGNITGGHKQGKNVITTANVAYDGSISGSSSRGPAQDGRIKPDIAAQGIVYAAEPGNIYINTSGTSFSAPSVAGVLAQLYQAYRTWNGGVDPESALIKACLLNTANDLGNVGPDYIYGWGHLNAYKAMKTIEENRYFSDLIDASEQNEHQLTVGPDVQELRVMVYWPDVPGEPMSAKALVNNLDMQLIAPNGDTLLPYVLDPSPNAGLLDLPATNGVDDLNNMEQVRIDLPVAGTYTLLVNGTEVPMGAQKYFVLWEETNNELMLTYPNGGECLSTDPEHTIHWDAHGEAGDFLLEYSPDNGMTWQMIATVPGNLRNYDWTLPATYSGLALVRVSRDGLTDMSNATFSIMDPPQNVEVTAACPTYLTLTWDELPGATAYVIYKLGDRYMDSVGTTTMTTFDMPITNPTVSNWYAVSSVGPDNACSPRTYAENHNSGLLNCILNVDVAIGEGNLCPMTYVCGPYEEALSISVMNGGLMDQSDIGISYSLNGGAVVSETFAGPVAPGESGTYTFSVPLNPINGENNLKAWVTVVSDEAAFNDTLDYDFSIDTYGIPSVPGTYTQDFTDTAMPPTDWGLTNPDNGLTWEHDVVMGTAGVMTGVTKVNNYNYNATGQLDELICVPLDLTNIVDPLLSFDIAYVRYNANFADTLYVEATSLCGEGGCVNELLYYKFGTELATAADQTNNWSPTNANQWRNEVIDLSAFEGQEIILKFTNATGYGNGLFIDNINVFAAVAPEANFDIMGNDLCVFDEINIANNSTGAITAYEWDFGVGAFPASSLEAGPHDVTFSTPGTKTISLTVSGPLGNNTLMTDIEVAPLPEADFMFIAEELNVVFENMSSFGNTYLWSFGDGNMSDEENPEHDYDGSGDYLVVLEVTNDCGTVTYSETINVTPTSIIEGFDKFNFALSPNPGTDAVTVSLEDTQSRSFLLELYDARGQHLMTYKLQSQNGLRQHAIATADLPAGAYWFKLMNGEGIKTKRWIKQ